MCQTSTEMMTLWQGALQQLLAVRGEQAGQVEKVRWLVLVDVEVDVKVKVHVDVKVDVDVKMDVEVVVDVRRRQDDQRWN